MKSSRHVLAIVSFALALLCGRAGAQVGYGHCYRCGSMQPVPHVCSVPSPQPGSDGFSPGTSSAGETAEQRSARELNNEGVKHHKNGDYATAIGYYQRSLVALPSYALAAKNLALARQALQDAKDYAAAEAARLARNEQIRQQNEEVRRYNETIARNIREAREKMDRDTEATRLYIDTAISGLQQQIRDNAAATGSSATSGLDFLAVGSSVPARTKAAPDSGPAVKDGVAFHSLTPKDGFVYAVFENRNPHSVQVTVKYRNKEGKPVQTGWEIASGATEPISLGVGQHLLDQKLEFTVTTPWTP